MNELHYQGTPVLETARLILRCFTPEDADAMYRNWASSENVTRYLTWPTHSSPEISRMVLEDWTARYADPKTLHWAVTLKDSGEVIGDLAVVRVEESIACAELGWCMGERWWGQGIMPEAGHAVLGYLFDTVRFNRVEAKHDVNNPKSGRVMEKLGMRHEGIQRAAGRNNQGICDISVHAILRSDWDEAGR